MLQRIQKILASAGIASRRACENLIKAGRVSVNGITATIGDLADSDKDRIFLDGRLVEKQEKHIYVILNKPPGYVCSMKSQFDHSIVTELVNVPARVYPVGRLDKNSEGLLLLTNDGDLTQKLTHPSKGVSKIYIVKLDRQVSSEDTNKLLKGVSIDGRRVIIRKLHRVSKIELSIQIHEGRKHIVRKLFKKLGYKTIKLIRIQFGPLKLKNLRPGQWRYLTQDEVGSLLKGDRQSETTSSPTKKRL